MTSVHNTIYIMLLLGCNLLLCAAEPLKGKLYIQNDHPTFQFECAYTSYGWQKSSVTAYKAPICLDHIENIDDLKIRRYGTIMGLGAQYYNFQDQLNACKKNTDRDWVLHITWAKNGWAIDTHEKEEAPQQPKAITPLEYFTKATAYGPSVEPRHILDLPIHYTEEQVLKRKQVILEQIQTDSSLDKITAYYIKTIINMAARYAQALLSIQDKANSHYTKTLLTFREQLHPERLAHGAQIIRDIMQEKMPHFATQTEHLNAITDLVWHLSSIARKKVIEANISKEHETENQTYVIQDRDLQIYNFLLNYAKKVNPSIKGSLEDPALTISTNMYAYPRASSQFKQEQKRFRHYGIDIRHPGNILAQALLPTQKSHIIFGNLGNGYIFIKLEDAGIALQSAPKLGAEAVVTQAHILYPKVITYLSQVAPTYIKDWMQYYMCPESDPQKNKEKIPQIIQNSLQFIEQIALQQEQKQRIIQQFTQQGICGILNEIRNPSSPLTAIQKHDLSIYLSQLEEQGYDHQDIRHDTEIIISEDDITRRYIQ